MGVTAKQFEAMVSRVQGGGKEAPSTGSSDSYLPAVQGQVVIGIDPSLRGTGFGVIRIEKPTPVLLDLGVIECPSSLRRSQCLARIALGIRKVVERHSPEVCVIEGLFYAQNYRTALTMGEARGASLAAVAEGGLVIYELAPRKVKQAIVGYGAAQKDAVAKMVQRMLNLESQPQADAADALALALTHVQIHAPGSLTPPESL